MIGEVYCENQSHPENSLFIRHRISGIRMAKPGPACIRTFDKHPEEGGQVEVSDQDQGHAPRELNLTNRVPKLSRLEPEVVEFKPQISASGYSPGTPHYMSRKK